MREWKNMILIEQHVDTLFDFQIRFTKRNILYTKFIIYFHYRYRFLYIAYNLKSSYICYWINSLQC